MTATSSMAGRLLPGAAEPAEIAAAARNLVTTDNTHLTGQRVIADGLLRITF